MRRIGPPKIGPRRIKAKIVSKIRRTKAVAYTSDWPSISSYVIKRDGNRCTECGSTVKLEVHHVIPVFRGGKTIPINLKTICNSCHCKKPFHGHMVKTGRRRLPTSKR